FIEDVNLIQIPLTVQRREILRPLMAPNFRWKLLLLAGAIHVALTTAIFLIGHFRLLPNTFNENGIGITFAIDGKTYNQVAIDLVRQWKANGFIAWIET